MIHLLLLTIAIALAFALYEARKIAANIKAGVREELDHAELMLWRAASWLSGAALFMAFDALTWQAALWSIVPCLASFAIVHRFTLNKARKMPWWWMGAPLGFRSSKASHYDALWHNLAWWFSGLKYGDYGLGAANDPDYPEMLPAKLAYGFEIIVIVVTVLLHH